MRAELNSTSLAITLIAENSADKTALDAFYAAASAKIICAITRNQDTARSGHAVNPATYSNVIVTTS